jgi:hypothetical protein
MRHHTPDDSRSLDGRCVFPQCESPQTDKLRLPMCGHHIIKTHRLANMMVADLVPKTVEPAARARPMYSSTSGLVYFLRFGDLIKIGFTTNLRQRLSSIPHDEVLATVPGTMRDEKHFHQRFAHLRHAREWFRPGDDLLAYIESIREAA